MPTDKGIIRSQSRRGARSDKVKPVEAATRRLPEPTLCERCGAVFQRRTWRTDRAPSAALLARARWRVCPACKQQAADEWYGRVRLRGAFVAAHEAELRRRIANVAGRARATQPERRLVSVERSGRDLEVLTTSQKLAHRIVHELRKAFRGTASYRWTDDRTLDAVWERRDAGAGRRAAGAGRRAAG